MFGLLKAARVLDPQLGELRRARGLWRGGILLGTTRVPLVLSGPRKAPDVDAVTIARTVAQRYAGWQARIADALCEHYAPYAAAVAAGEAEPPQEGGPTIRAAAEVWPYTRVQFVQVTPLDGQLTVEIGYRVAWDAEHTLGARFRGDHFLELCGSVRAP